MLGMTGCARNDNGFCHPERSEGSRWVLRHVGEIPRGALDDNGFCHPERSEGSRWVLCHVAEIPRGARNDRLRSG